MNKPPLATNMHLCCRDGNHKHLYLLVNACTKTGVVEEKKKRREDEGKTGGGGEIVPFFNLGNERVAVSVVQNCVKAICLKHFLE